MKVKIGKYPTYYTCYHIARWFCFWEKRELFSGKDYFSDKLGNWLAHKKNGDYTWLANFLQWFNEGREQKIKVRIDPWDTWSMDYTLARIALPMLKQLREDSHGAPCVDDEDVPEELKSTSAPPKEKPWDVDDNHFKRWDWALGEMIAAFEMVLGKDEFVIERNEDAYKRRDNGLRLFGKYYMGLWD